MHNMTINVEISGIYAWFGCGPCASVISRCLLIDFQALREGKVVIHNRQVIMIADDKHNISCNIPYFSTYHIEKIFIHTTMNDDHQNTATFF